VESASIIKLEALTREFKEIIAISEISLEINRGELFGLIGPDGAGKTTLLRTLAGLLRISSGAGEVAGYSLKSDAEKVKGQIGYMAQDFGLYDKLTVRENLRFFADLFDVPRSEISAREAELLAFANLTEFVNRRADQLSGGMQKKLALACCLIHKPNILLLDEPTTGVDPISRREFWNILAGLHIEGVTIVVSTPYMDEADRCSRIGLINEGKLLQVDPPARIREMISQEMLVLIVENSEGIENVLAEIPGIKEIQGYGESFHLLVEDCRKQERVIRKTLRKQGFTILELYQTLPKMEQAFISLVSEMV
jgi:ABC-2 type transport system ATP-binding protein